MFQWAIFKRKVCKSVFDKYLIMCICIVAYVWTIQKRIKRPFTSFSAECCNGIRADNTNFLKNNLLNLNPNSH